MEEMKAVGTSSRAFQLTRAFQPTSAVDPLGVIASPSYALNGGIAAPSAARQSARHAHLNSLT